MSETHAAIEALYQELGPVLLAYARSLLGDAALAEDAVQQVFLKLIASERSLPREPRPYLFRAVRNDCFNRRRTNAREAVRRHDPPMFTAPNGLTALVPDLERALAELPEEQREVLVLRVWGEMTLEGAAQTLDVPLNTVASRYRYALVKLRRRFGVHLRPS